MAQEIKNNLGLQIYNYVKNQESRFSQEYPFINAHEVNMAGRITGMLLNVPMSDVIRQRDDIQYRISRIEEALDTLDTHYEEMNRPESENEEEYPQESKQPIDNTQDDDPCNSYITLDTCDGPLIQILNAVQDSIHPDWQHGNLPMLQIPFMGKLLPKHLPMLQRVCKSTRAFHVRINLCYVTEVTGSEDVHAFGIAFESPDLRKFKDTLLREMGCEPGTDKSKVHDPYQPISGHITLARCHSRFKNEVEQICQGLQVRHHELRLMLKTVTFENTATDRTNSCTLDAALKLDDAHGVVSKSRDVRNVVVTSQEARSILDFDPSELQVFQECDAKDPKGLWYTAEVMAKEGTRIKIHFSGWNQKHDIWRDLANPKDLECFAPKTIFSRWRELKGRNYTKNVQAASLNRAQNWG